MVGHGSLGKQDDIRAAATRGAGPCAIASSSHALHAGHPQAILQFQWETDL